jgi:hypothetical protein
MVDVDRSDDLAQLARRLRAAQLEFDRQAQRFEEARSRLQATVDIASDRHPLDRMLGSSEFARLQARLNSMPVIEQAKGILMAEQQCGPDEAFDLLRRASQRTNVKLRLLAAQIVDQVAADRSGSRGQPGPPGDGETPEGQDIPA